LAILKVGARKLGKVSGDPGDEAEGKMKQVENWYVKKQKT